MKFQISQSGILTDPTPFPIIKFSAEQFLLTNIEQENRELKKKLERNEELRKRMERTEATA